jgi:hypothetical protein
MLLNGVESVMLVVLSRLAERSPSEHNDPKRCIYARAEYVQGRNQNLADGKVAGIWIGHAGILSFHDCFPSRVRVLFGGLDVPPAN